MASLRSRQGKLQQSRPHLMNQALQAPVYDSWQRVEELGDIAQVTMGSVSSCLKMVAERLFVLFVVCGAVSATVTTASGQALC